MILMVSRCIERKSYIDFLNIFFRKGYQRSKKSQREIIIFPPLLLFACFDTSNINASCFLHIPQFVSLDVLTGKHKNRKSWCLF